jgi:hypothetical protein
MKTVTFLLLASVFFISGCRRSASENSRFSEYGLTFDYPRDLRVETVGGPVQLIILESDNGTRMVLSIYATPSVPEDLQKIAAEGIRKAAIRKDSSKSLTETESQRLVAGALRTGTTFTDVWEGKQRTTQLYTFASGKGAMSVLLQNTAEASREAGSIFEIVLNSMTVQNE